jgi:hypothetical protein
MMPGIEAGTSGASHEVSTNYTTKPVLKLQQSMLAAKYWSCSWSVCRQLWGSTRDSTKNTLKLQSNYLSRFYISATLGHSSWGHIVLIIFFGVLFCEARIFRWTCLFSPSDHGKNVLKYGGAELCKGEGRGALLIIQKWLNLYGVPTHSCYWCYWCYCYCCCHSCVLLLLLLLLHVSFLACSHDATSLLYHPKKITPQDTQKVTTMPDDMDYPTTTMTTTTPAPGCCGAVSPKTPANILLNPPDVLSHVCPQWQNF